MVIPNEVEVVRAVLEGRADAGAIGSPFWNTVRKEHLIPEGGLREIWSSPAYNHCMFTARPALDREQETGFVEALLAMSYDNPAHRPILEAEGLERWLTPHTMVMDLSEAATQQGFFKHYSRSRLRQLSLVDRQDDFLLVNSGHPVD